MSSFTPSNLATLVSLIGNKLYNFLKLKIKDRNDEIQTAKYYAQACD